MQLKRKKFIDEKLPPKHCELNYWFFSLNLSKIDY